MSTESLSTAASTAFKIDQSVQNLPTFLQLADTYADNFDLSLLPQDFCGSTNSIPITVQQYSGNNFSIQTPPAAQTLPQIKIEETCKNTAENANKEIEEQKTLNLSYVHHQKLLYAAKPQYQLIPPPAYPQLYPSPQSSPAQTEYAFPQQHCSFNSYDSLSLSQTSLYTASPCPSLDMQIVKQEVHILPPSPPESNCETPSPHSACSDIKAEPLDAEVEAFVDLNSMFEKSQNSNCQAATNLHGLSGHTLHADTENQQNSIQQQDHQVLREYLEDTSFQHKHKLKPLALDSFIGGLEAVRGDIEPVISLALEHAKREAEAMCAKLQISNDPSAWSTEQVHAWLRSTTSQFELPQIIDLETKFIENGAGLLLLSEEEFARRAPESGSTLHAQLDIWKMAFSGNDPLQSNLKLATNESTANINWTHSSTSTLYMDTEEDSEDEDETLLGPTTSAEIPVNTLTPATTNAEPKRRTGGSHIHLWQFLKELLSAPHVNGTAIRWIDRSKGIFKIEDSVRVAKLWGRRKNRPAMNYDKLSRSIRQYYKKGIMKKTERSQRLVYQFCEPYHL